MSLKEPLMLSHPAANACIYTTYCIFLVMGLGVAWAYRSRGEFLAGNHTRRGLYLAFNFIASGMGCGILVTYPPLAATLGLHGLLVYSLAGALPLFLFAFLGPLIRKHSPNGFVMTEWVRQRYGPLASLTISACTILTLYLFAVSELASIEAAITSMTGLDGLPPLLVESLFVALYTSCGGFFTSFFTDNIQAAAFLVLLVIAIVAMGVEVPFDSSFVGPSGLLKANRVSWRLVYILPVAITTNDCFMAGFWMRTFAARSDKDLLIGCSIAAFVLFACSVAIGVTGLIAVWSGLLDPSSDTFYYDSQNAFYLVLLQTPRWVQGFVLVFVVCLSTCTFDSLVSALTSTISNDVFRNRVRLIYMRILTFALMAPIVVVALRATNILTIFLVCDLLSAAVIPVLFFGLSRKFYWLSGFEIIASLIGGILTTFVFGCIYTGSASGGGSTLLLTEGLYVDDWLAFGAFVAAPVGSFIGAGVGLVLRGCVLAVQTGHFWAVFDRDQEQWDAGFMRLITPKSTPWYEGKAPIFKKIDWLFLIPAGETNPEIPHDAETEGGSSIKDSKSGVVVSDALS